MDERDECGPVFGPMDWIEYVCKSKNLDPSSLDVGEVLIVTSINRIWSHLIEKLGLRCNNKWLYECNSRWGLHNGFVSGKKISLMYIGVGPGEAGVVEEVLALGRTRHILYIGYCGGVGSHVDIGDFIIVTGGVCEDGLSQHYIPHGIGLDVDKTHVDILSRILEDMGLRYHRGRIWSLPAPFREHRWKLREYHEKWNVLGVEMEVCSLLAVAKYYGIGFSSIQLVSDTVYPKHRIGFHEKRLEENISRLYLIVVKTVGSLTI